MDEAELLAVISSTKENAVLCQYKDCGCRVYKRIHVVRVNSTVEIYGSSCSKTLFESGQVVDVTVRPPVRSMERLLTPRDMELLLSNTEKLLIELRRQYELMDSVSSSSESEPDVSQWSDDKLYDHCIERAKNEFRDKRGLDPNKPGWIGFLRQDAAELYRGYRGGFRAVETDGTPYQRGMASFYESAGVYTNPYPKDSRDYLGFENGWSQAIRRSSTGRR